MKIQRIAVGITVANLFLMTILLAHFRTANAKEQHNYIEPVLRGRALEIVDSLGKVRASISIMPPVTMDGKQYPETVLLQLTNEQGKPVVKVGGNRNGAEISLVNTSDEGVLVHATDEGSDIKITYKGKEKIVQP